MPARFDSVIFDLDGTLWNASASITRAFQAAVASVDYLGHDVTLAQVQAVIGQLSVAEAPKRIVRPADLRQLL